jgi:type II secretion system (T2SS) protein G
MTISEMNEISGALKNYKSEIGEYPENLNELIGNRPLKKTWSKDAWGIEYNYSKIENGTKYKLISFGIDNKSGTENDLIIRN